jgi:HD-GYP domain-containing protein (c-di-GMP phosphodiesterase class II)
MAGTQFDPDVVNALLRILREQPLAGIVASKQTARGRDRHADVSIRSRA